MITVPGWLRNVPRGRTRRCADSTKMTTLTPKGGAYPTSISCGIAMRPRMGTCRPCTGTAMRAANPMPGSTGFVMRPNTDASQRSMSARWQRTILARQSIGSARLRRKATSQRCWTMLGRAKTQAIESIGCGWRGSRPSGVRRRQEGRGRATAFILLLAASSRLPVHISCLFERSGGNAQRYARRSWRAVCCIRRAAREISGAEVRFDVYRRPASSHPDRLRCLDNRGNRGLSMLARPCALGESPQRGRLPGLAEMDAVQAQLPANVLLLHGPLGRAVLLRVPSIYAAVGRPSCALIAYFTQIGVAVVYLSAFHVLRVEIRKTQAEADLAEMRRRRRWRSGSRLRNHSFNGGLYERDVDKFYSNQRAPATGTSARR